MFFRITLSLERAFKSIAARINSLAYNEVCSQARPDVTIKTSLNKLAPL